VLTKQDTLKPKDLQKSLQSVFDHIMNLKASAVMPYVHAVSAETGYGIEDLQLSISEVASQKWADPYKEHTMSEVSEMAKQREASENMRPTPEMLARIRKYNIPVDDSHKDNYVKPVLPAGFGVLAPDQAN
jgi:50S ribosomal subunit-associated GTPase HflX